MFSLVNLYEILLFLTILVFSVSLHEAMHAYVAHKLGDNLAHSRGRISLNPLQHIDPVLTIFLPLMMLLIGQSPILAAKPVPINTSRLKGDELGFAVVGIAGPLTNLLIATIAALLFNNFVGGAGTFRLVLELIIRLNVSLFVFNMLPIPPLDGSRLLYAFAPTKVQELMYRFEQLGMVTILIIFMVGLPILIGPLSSANQTIVRLLIGA